MLPEILVNVPELVIATVNLFGEGSTNKLTLLDVLPSSVEMMFFTLKLFTIQLKPLLFVAPRGLITILLFLSIPSDQSINILNKSLIIQIIIMTALMMMIGLMFKKETNLNASENNIAL